MNITDYALCENERFDIMRLNSVDSLIFSQLCYYDFAKLLENYSEANTKLYIKDISLDENLPYLFKNMKMKKDGVNFCYALSQSSRFRDVEIINQVTTFSKDETKQFSATTFILNDEYAYVAFRGTDSSIVGWKEDFMIAYLDSMPSHNVALEYLNRIMNILTYPHIYIGGHSKGGNLAVYATVFAQKKLKDRVVAVYNHDGPGFKKEFFTTPEFVQIKEKIVCIVPENSVVGMIWDNGENMQIIKSKNLGVFQHNPFSWIVQGDDFAHSSALSGFSQEFKKSLNDWLCDTSNAKKESFFNAFINVFEKAESTSFGDFFKNMPKNLPILMTEMHKLDPETKGMFGWVIKKIASIYVKNSNVVKAGSGVASKINSTIVRVGDKLKDSHSEKRLEKEGSQQRFDITLDENVIEGVIIDDSFNMMDATDKDGNVLKHIKKKDRKKDLE